MDRQWAEILAQQVIPVVVIGNSAHARPLGEALLAGGLRTVEVTLRTPASEAALSALAQIEGLAVGAGTVLDPAQLERAASLGATFAVSPGLDPGLVQCARQLGLPYLPGVATASEVQAARRSGIELVKLFPSEPLGGPAFIRALSAPFPDLRFVPTGGINAHMLVTYLSERSVAAVGGGWIADPESLQSHDWAGIAARARHALSCVENTLTTDARR